MEPRCSNMQIGKNTGNHPKRMEIRRCFHVPMGDSTVGQTTTYYAKGNSKRVRIQTDSGIVVQGTVAPKEYKCFSHISEKTINSMFTW